MEKKLISVNVTTIEGHSFTFDDSIDGAYGTSVKRSLELHQRVDSAATGDGGPKRCIIPLHAIDYAYWEVQNTSAVTPVDMNCAGAELPSIVITSDKTIGGDVNITITLSDTSINGTYGDLTFENGVANATYYNTALYATGLPDGVGVTVSTSTPNASVTPSSNALPVTISVAVGNK